jgi:hypothetical protein
MPSRVRRIGSSRAQLLANQLQWGAQELMLNPPVAPPRTPTAQEIAVKRAQATAAAYEADYRNRKTKEAAESATALENGRRVDVFRDYKMTPDEQKMFARTKPELIPELLAAERRCRPNPEINRLYELITPSLIGGKQ